MMRQTKNPKSLPPCKKPPKPAPVRLTLMELQQLYIQTWNYPPQKKKPKSKYPLCDEPKSQERAYLPCWEMKTIPRHIMVGPCWDFQVKKKIIEPKITKLKKQQRRQFIRISPKIDQCITLYTQLDFKLEQCVHEQILKLDVLFENLRKQLIEEKEKQKLLLDIIRVQTTRYRILVRSGICVKPYPEFVSAPAEKRALCEYQKCLEKLTLSNMSLAEALVKIKDNMAELMRRVDRLDKTLLSPFLLGEGTGAPSMASVIEMLQDLYKYFYGVVCKMKRWAELIDAGDECSQDDYVALLNDTHDFPTLMQIGTENCTCKRNDSKHPLEPYVPCWCQRYELYMKEPKPWPNYRCEVQITAKLSSSTSRMDEEEFAILEPLKEPNEHNK